MATSTAVMASTLAASNYCHRHHHHNHQGWFWYLEPPHPHDLDHGHNHDNLDPDNHDHDNTVIRDVLGTWKHYNLSAETLAARNTRARSPLQSRELDRSSLLIILFIINILIIIIIIIIMIMIMMKKVFWDSKESELHWWLQCRRNFWFPLLQLQVMMMMIISIIVGMKSLLSPKVN